MDTTTKVILLFLMYGLPVVVGVIYKLSWSIREKTQLNNPVRLNNINSGKMNITMKNKKQKNVYAQMQRFANLTKTLIIHGNIARAKKCFGVAEKLLTEESDEVKNAVINVFVYSVATHMEVRRCNIKNLFPVQLAGEYYKQVNTNYS